MKAQEGTAHLKLGGHISGKGRESRSVMSDSFGSRGLYSPWHSPGQNTGVGSPSLLQWIFPTQELNWGLLHCRWILYQLSYEGSPTSQGVTTESVLNNFDS